MTRIKRAMKQINDLGAETSNTNLDGTIDPEAIEVEQS